jgi:hypothetical protein
VEAVGRSFERLPATLAGKCVIPSIEVPDADYQPNAPNSAQVPPSLRMLVGSLSSMEVDSVQVSARSAALLINPCAWIDDVSSMETETC